MGIKCYMIDPVFHETKLNHSGEPAIIGWKRADTGEQHDHIRDFPPGAMWYCTWLESSKRFVQFDGITPRPKPWHPGPDGRVLCVLTPGGEWLIDGRASNCTMPTDDEHHCWCRHGDAPNITVDKNGNTCAAGAGSIQCGSYHGFLRNGELVQA